MNFPMSSLPSRSALLGLSALLAAAAPAMATPPLSRVVHTDTPPSLNAEAMDQAWQKAVAITDFIVPGSAFPIQEGLQVRFLWDDTHLYLFARLEESTLAVTSQRMDEIRAAAKERDDAVLMDDSFLLMLRPEGGGEAYELTINSKGVMGDARCNVADLWKKRDASWNPAIRSLTHVGDGFWTVTMAIPWKELGAKPPANGERWEALIARNAPSRSERGVWTPSDPGIHSPREWGVLVFGQSAAGVAATPLTHLTSGGNTLGLTLNPAASGEESRLLLSTRMTPQRGPARTSHSRQTLTLPSSGSLSTTHHFEAPADGMMEFSWALADAATLEPIYRSPEMRLEVLSSTVSLSVSTSGPWELLVNDRKVASGVRAELEQVPLSLRGGMNVVALRTESGTARLTLDPQFVGDAPIRWKLGDGAAATDAATDDSGWPTAPELEGGEVGKAGAPAVLRHTIFFRETRIFPQQLPAIHIAGGGVQPVSFIIPGVRGRALADWKTWVELPSAVEPLTVSGYYGGRADGKARFELHEEAANRYRIDADAPITVRSGHPILSLFDLFLKQREGAARDGELTLRYYSRANDFTLSEVEQSAPLALLPALNGRQPKELTFQIWGNYTRVLDDPKAFAALTETAKAAGFNDFVGAVRKDVEGKNFKATLLVNFRSHSLNLKPWLAEHPEARLINAQREPVDGLMCTTRFLEGGWKEAGAPLLEAWWKKNPVDVVNYDYEYPPFTGPHSCFCERCLNSFRTAVKLADDQPLSPEVIREKYSAEWVDFMARRVAKIFRAMKETVHGLPGKVLFEAYSGYQTPENAARYGVDWRYMGEQKAADRVGVGYGRPVPAISETVKALEGIPVIFGELVYPYMKAPLDYQHAGVPVTKANLLRRFIDASGGALIYHTQNMDGRSWFAAAEISRLVAEYESLFGALRGEPVGHHPEAEVVLLKNDQQAVLCVMNPGRQEKSYRIDLPEGWEGAHEFYSGRPTPKGEALSFQLAPGEAAAFAPVSSHP